MVSLLSHGSKVLVNYLTSDEDGLARLERRLRETASERPGGKFSKKEAAYLPESPVPPVLWRNECERCRFYHDGQPGEPATCHIVGRPDDPFGGEAIHPRGWCGVYMPPEGEPALRWLTERLGPTGATSVRGQYRDSLDAVGVESDSETREREIPVTEAGDGRE